MIIDLAEDYTDFDTHRLDLASLTSRRDDLVGEREDYEAEGETLPDSDAEELNALNAFLAQIDRLGIDHDYADAAVESEFESFVRYQAEEDHGLDAGGLGDYVDWERYAKDRRSEFEELELDGQVVLVK